MPSRVIRAGINTSERVNLLEAQEEVFYRRLLLEVDDHGLLDARPLLLRSRLYPLRADRVREADISRWLAACQTAGLILLYESSGKPYLKALDTRWIARSSPKYPLPPDGLVNGCAQLQTSVHNCDRLTSLVSRLSKSSIEKSSEPDGVPANSLPPSLASPDVFPNFSTVGGKRSAAKVWTLTDAQIAEWTEVFPAVDVAAECREAWAWVRTNPSKRKTAAGMPDFLRRWLAKCQDRGGSSPGRPSGKISGMDREAQRVDQMLANLSNEANS